jgi:hypothetical protein
MENANRFRDHAAETPPNASHLQARAASDGAGHPLAVAPSCDRARAAAARMIAHPPWRGPCLGSWL